jgi:hypothetical protein
VGVEVEIAVPSFTVQTVIPFPLLTAILNFGSRKTSDNVRSDIVRSGIIENVGVAVEIAAPSLAVQTLFPLPVLLVAILNFGSRPTSTNVGQRLAVSSVSSQSRRGRKCGGAAFGIASQYPTVQKLFPLPVWWPPS